MNYTFLLWQTVDQHHSIEQVNEILIDELTLIRGIMS